MQIRSPLTHAILIVLLKLTSNVESLFPRGQFGIFVRDVASTFHENWRGRFRSEHPYVQNRFKLTEYGSQYNSFDFIYPMILTVGSCLVHRNLKVARDRFNSSLVYIDVLNMNYDQLPEDWASENRATARVACTQVLYGVKKKRVFNRKFIERVSEVVHKAWIKRNHHRTKQELLLSYQDLPEREKAKDRSAILIACRIFNELRLYVYFNTSPIVITEPFIE